MSECDECLPPSPDMSGASADVICTCAELEQVRQERDQSIAELAELEPLRGGTGVRWIRTLKRQLQLSRQHYRDLLAREREDTRRKYEYEHRQRLSVEREYERAKGEYLASLLETYKERDRARAELAAANARAEAAAARARGWQEQAGKLHLEMPALNQHMGQRDIEADRLRLRAEVMESDLRKELAEELTLRRRANVRAEAAEYALKQQREDAALNWAEVNGFLKQQRERAEAAERMLHDLTPTGSEFVGNPKRCFGWAQERIRRLTERAVMATAERKAAERRVQEVEAQCVAMRSHILLAMTNYPFSIWSDVIDGMCVHLQNALKPDAGCELLVKLERYEKALEYYCDSANYNQSATGEIYVLEDGGRIARQMLEKESK